jgi:hypothetical protein
MSRSSIWNAKFDRANDFIVSKPFRVRGIDLVAGDAFDKTMVTTRTLRQLFESRKLKVATVPIPAQPLPFRVKHIGAGRFGVFHGDERLTAEPLTREEAEADAAAR